MAWEIPDEQITYPFTQLPDPNRIIVVADGPPEEEQKHAVCIGKYKGAGVLTGVLDHGFIYLPDNYDIEDLTIKNYVIKDTESWYYLSDDISDASEEIQMAVDIAKDEEISLLSIDFYNACRGLTHEQKDDLFSELDQEVKHRINSIINYFYLSIRDQPNAKKSLFSKLHPELQIILRSREKKKTDTRIALMRSTGMPRDPARHVTSFMKFGGKRKTVKRVI